MDLFGFVEIRALSPGDLFKFGKDCYFPYRFIERLRTIDGFLLYNIRRCEYTVLLDIHSYRVYLLSDEEKERIKLFY